MQHISLTRQKIKKCLMSVELLTLLIMEVSFEVVFFQWRMSKVWAVEERLDKR